MKLISNHSRSSAPGKVILFGEHFVVYNKPAILASIDRRVYVDVRIRSDDMILVGSDRDARLPVGKAGKKSHSLPKAMIQPIVTAAKDALHTFDGKVGLDIFVRSEIPFGAGLGSSAACSVATIAAVGALFGRFNRKQISEMSLNAEKLVHGNPSGADSAICTYGGVMLFNKDRGAKPIRSNIDVDLVVANSGIRRTTGKMVSLVKKKFEQQPEIFMGLVSMSESITLRALNAIRSKDYEELGALMTLDHSLLRRLGVSRNILDRLVRIALDNDALGAKLTGAGGGGCIIALTQKNSAERVWRAMRGYDAFMCNVEHEGVVVEKV
jgi:mevalonate kinase